MRINLELKGDYKDLRIRWWTCWRPDGVADIFLLATIQNHAGLLQSGPPFRV